MEQKKNCWNIGWIAYERMGNYDEAIAAGSKLLRINPTEQINLKLADLYSLKW